MPLRPKSDLSGTAELWLSAFLVISALPELLGPGANQQTVKVALIQLLLAALVPVVGRWSRSLKPPLDWLGWMMWAALLPWTYAQIDTVQRSLALPFQDGRVESWDVALLGFSPALRWSESMPYLGLSEPLHFFYFLYYAVLPTLLIRLLRRGAVQQAYGSLLAGVSTMTVCYGISGLFPVQGPRPLLAPLPPELHGPFWTITHGIIKGAAAAAAFPSGHVALAAAVTTAAWHWDRAWFPLYVVWTLGIWSATVYGRFHYAVDGLAGTLVAVSMASWAVSRLRTSAAPPQADSR